MYTKNFKLSCTVILIFFLGTPVCRADLSKFKATPNQVLVLYNADYEMDADGSLPGQDSEEVARYYLEKHTDKVTGRRPYLLGLSCRHGKTHLNDWVIREDSDDNKNGVIYTGDGKGPAPDEWARDSRYVEIMIKEGQVPVNWDSVGIWCESLKTGEKKKVAPKVSGIPLTRRKKTTFPEISDGKGRCFRFNAKKMFSGRVWVYVKAEDAAGNKIKNLKLLYYDIDDFKFSMLGPDNVSDELHFQEDVAIPLKEFLEDPHHRQSDGTLLKDHILYIVVCHGLPFSADGVLGIERGVTAKQSDHGDLGSLEQRLQTLYYGWGARILPPVISMYMSGGPDSKEGVRNHRITTAMRYPMAGRRWNPYMHPDTYSFLGSKKTPDHIDLPPLPEKRKALPPYFFAYGASRLDGPGPDEAKRQIDYALYASRYLRPEMDMGIRNRKKQESTAKLSGLVQTATKKNVWGSSEQRVLGFQVMTSNRNQGIPFLGRPFEDYEQGGLFSKKKDRKEWLGYYPGGMDRTVVSSNGWNGGRGAGIWEQVDHGVTVSACGGPAYGGGPHITNATFWDNRILQHYLFRGRDLGECFLLSTLYVNWSTSLLGDPLYHPDLSQTVADTTPPRVRSREDIKINIFPAMGHFAGQITVPVISSNAEPEVATLTLYYKKKGEVKEMVSRWPIYSTRPRAVLRHLEPDSVYSFRPVLSDPFGNTTDVSAGLGPLQFRIGRLSASDPEIRTGRKRGQQWEIPLLKRKLFSESGTLEVVYSSKADPMMPVVRSKDIAIAPFRGQSSFPFIIGGPSRGWASKKRPIPSGDNITMIVRWRRFPLTRELLFRTKNGREFTYAADVRTPWKTMALRDPIKIGGQKQITIHSVTLSGDALPASKEACMLSVPPFDTQAWAEAQ